MAERTTRRNFIMTSVAVAGGIVGASALQQNASNSVTPPAMPERVLGRTGVKLPIFGLGGAGQTPLSSEGKEKDAAAIIEKALLIRN